MKKYMIMAVMLFAQAQDVVCSARLGSLVRRFGSSTVVKNNETSALAVYTGEVKNFRDFQRKFPTTTGVLIALGVTVVGGFGVNELHDRTLGRERQEKMSRDQEEILRLQGQVSEQQKELAKATADLKLQLAGMQGQLTVLGQLRCPKQNCPPCVSDLNSINRDH